MPLVAPRPRPVFRRLVVARVRPVTADAVEVTFDVPQELVREFAHRSGQYVTVRARIDGSEVQRSYSICTVPGEPLRIAVKRASGGLFSAWAVDHLREGDVLEVLRPTGAFTAPDDARRVVALAAGSGITPVLPIVRTLLDRGVSVDLVDVNRTRADVMFADEIDDLARRHADALRVHHVLTREAGQSDLLTGRLDADRFDALLATLPGEVDHWLLCGPPALIDTIRGRLRAAGVPDGAVRYESFVAGSPVE